MSDTARRKLFIPRWWLLSACIPTTACPRRSFLMRLRSHSWQVRVRGQIRGLQEEICSHLEFLTFKINGYDKGYESQVSNEKERGLGKCTKSLPVADISAPLPRFQQNANDHFKSELCGSMVTQGYPCVIASLNTGAIASFSTQRLASVEHQPYAFR